MKKILIITNICLCLALIVSFVQHNHKLALLHHELEDSMQDTAWCEIAKEDLAANNENLQMEINEQAEELKLKSSFFQTGEFAKCQEFAIQFDPEENEQFQE